MFHLMELFWFSSLCHLNSSLSTLNHHSCVWFVTPFSHRRTPFWIVGVNWCLDCNNMFKNWTGFWSNGSNLFMETVSIYFHFVCHWWPNFFSIITFWCFSVQKFRIILLQWEQELISKFLIKLLFFFLFQRNKTN